MFFQITYRPIKETMTSLGHHTGALVSFKGIVRNINHDKHVTQIEYEVYDKMVLSEGNKILKYALASYDIIHARAIHRAGIIPVGETAILLEVSAVHRKEAFLACQEIMDQIKNKLPIWKKESYVGHQSEWVLCCHHH